MLRWLKKFKIGAVRDGSSEQIAVKKGKVPLDQMERLSTFESAVLMLANGRIDLYASSMENIRIYSKRLNLDADQFENVFSLDKAFLCFAFNPDTADELVDAFQKALDSMKQDGTYDRLYNMYFD